jgi:hypothetical protein
MTDFFDQLEADLRVAALRRPRPNLVALPAVAAALVVALALGATALVLGGRDDGRVAGQSVPPGLSPVGTVIPKGSGKPPRERASMVVAIGKTPVGGPWQLEVSRIGDQKNPKTGEVYLEAGPCLWLYRPSPRNSRWGSFGGYCGPGQLDFRKTPGFSRAQTVLPPVARRADGTRVRPREVVVFGRAPAQASKVVLTLPHRGRFAVDPQPAPPGFKKRFGFDASFYAIAVPGPKPVAGSRINWLDAAGKPGSRGIRMMPPLVPLKH